MSPAPRRLAQHRFAPRHSRQRGLALVSALAVTLAIVLMLVAAWTSAAAARLEARQQLDREAQLALAGEVLSAWYRAHLAELDSPGSEPPDPAEALSGLGLARSVRVGVSALQSRGAVLGRILVAWMPATAAADERFDAASGVLLGSSAGTRAIRVDGPALEQEAVMRAQRQLQHLASALELRFRARVVDDPLHRMDINHFRPLDPACVALMDELPCVPDYARADRFAFWQGQLDIAAGELQSPWGATYPLEISNGRDASVAPPFSLALRVLTPWGTLLQVRAVEPGA